MSLHESSEVMNEKAMLPLVEDESNQITEEKKEDEEDVPTTDPNALEKWNSSRTQIYRYLCALLGLFIMGMNDAAYGALIPYLEPYYNVDYTIISLVFLTPFLGYSLAAFLNNKIHMKFGQLGIAVMGPSFRIVAYVITCIHPPFPVLPIIFVVAGFGNGLEDGGWNAWVGNMENANELLGFLHGAYGLGATVSPLIATAMVTKGHLAWYNFYYLMIGLAAFEFVVCVTSFRKATGAIHRAKNPQTHSATGDSRNKEALRNPITWMCAIFLFCYVGVEVSLGGWLVTFMLRVRHGEEFASGLVVTGFWLGLTFGRVLLGFVTGRIGEKLAIACYLLICLVLELLFWLIPSFVSSAIFAGWLGFFLGPLFPAAIVVATRLIPQRLHVSAIGFVAAFGGGGAAIFPFVVGAIAQAKGVQVLEPFALALLVLISALWCLLPGGFKKRGLGEFQRARQEGRAGVIEEGEENLMSRNVNRVRRKMGLL